MLTLTPTTCIAVLGLTASLLRPGRLSGQSDFGGWASAGGAALGAATGGIVGSLGTLVPCNDTYAGPHCVRAFAVGGAVVGGVSGALLGGHDPEGLGDRAVGGAIGFGIGSVLGFGLTPFIERWSAPDALALGLIGGAVGSAPIGGAIGFGAGAVAGALLWRTVPDFGSADASTAALAGLAAGVLTEWVVRGISAAAGGTPVSIAYHVRF